MLYVYKNETRVGLLDIQASEPFYGFSYDIEYLALPEARPLSLSLPLTGSRYTGEQAQPYFEGLLPEGEARDAIARRYGISRSSSVKLLEALGRDCAGDVSIISESGADGAGTAPGFSDAPDSGAEAVGSGAAAGYDISPGSDSTRGANRSHEYYPFADAISRISESPRDVMTRIREGTRLSLAGGQEKIALYHSPGESIREGWRIPARGSPSTHIIKPGLLESEYPHITLNEFLCMRAAPECGVQAAFVDILYPETPVIIIKRYDRIITCADVKGRILVSRIHQEDCCQACGIRTDMKYEHDGGPGFRMIRDLLARHAKNPAEDIRMLLKWGVFNYLIGNCDAHAKNLSLLHNADGTVALAPAYDLISTSLYDGRFGEKLSRNMGMRIGGHENLDRVNPEDFKSFAGDIRVRNNQVRKTGEEIMRKLTPAFNAAAQAAEKEGFTGAREISDRILSGCEKRSEMMFST